LNASSQALREFCEATGGNSSECRQTTLIKYLADESQCTTRFPDWCHCDICETSRIGDDHIRKENFSLECKLILGGVAAWSGKSKGIIVDLLMGSTARKVMGSLNLNLSS